MPFKGIERRHRTRFRVRVPFVLKASDQEIRGTTRNMSLLGISAFTNSSMPQVQPVQCILELPQDIPPVTVNGTVIRCEPLSQPHPDGAYEIGVFFKEFQKKGETTLMKFLDQIVAEEQSAIQQGYQVLRQRLVARRRRKRLEAQRKKKRQLERLRRRRAKLRTAQRRRSTKATNRRLRKKPSKRPS